MDIIAKDNRNYNNNLNNNEKSNNKKNDEHKTTITIRVHNADDNDDDDNDNNNYYYNYELDCGDVYKRQVRHIRTHCYSRFKILFCSIVVSLIL